MNTKSSTLYTWISEALKYIETVDFRNGVTVELAGMLVDILLLAVLVPTFIWLFGWKKRRRNRAMASFFTLQFIRDMAELMLRSGGAVDTQALLEKALSTGKLGGLSSHPFYGNTEDLFALLRIRMSGGEHVAGYKILSDEDIEQLVVFSQDILYRLDQYIFLFSSLGLTEYSEKYFEARMLVFPMRDHFLSLKRGDRERFDDTETIKSLSAGAAAYFHNWFSAARLGPDRSLERQIIWQKIQMFLLIPLLLAYRFIVPFFCQALRIPYRDPTGSNFFSAMLTAICSASDVDLKKVSEKTSIETDVLVSYCMQYQEPIHDEQVRILLAIRPLFDETRWCCMVLENIEKDTKRQMLKLVLGDSTHANAAVWLLSVTNGLKPKGIDLGTELMKVVLRR